jgi:hypothetical protein
MEVRGRGEIEREWGEKDGREERTREPVRQRFIKFSEVQISGRKHHRRFEYYEPVPTAITATYRSGGDRTFGLFCSSGTLISTVSVTFINFWLSSH